MNFDNSNPCAALVVDYMACHSGEEIDENLLVYWENLKKKEKKKSK